MRALGNVLWHLPFLGFLSAAYAFVLGSLLTITVVGAPVGLGLLQYSKFLLAPFGQAMISRSAISPPRSGLWRIYSILVAVLYIPFGLVFAVLSIIQIVLLCVTIIGIPVAMVVAKSLGTIFNPVGKVCVSSAMAAELDRERGQAELARRRAA